MRMPITTVAACLAATMLLGGCTSGDAATLPPLEASAVAGTYDEQLAELGLRLTDRGGLMDEEGYEPDPEGTHLSLYVVPVGERDDQAYVDGIVEVTALFARDVFDRWPGLESFDVCQEAVPTEEGATPPARTQVKLTKQAAESVDWTTADVGDVLAAAEQDSASSVLILDSSLRPLAREALNQ